MSNESDSFFQEVEEGVRQDRYVALARKYGPAALGAIVVLLAAIAGWRLYESWQVGEAHRASERLAAAQKQVSEGDFQAAGEAFEAMSKSGPTTYRVLAMMERAQVLQQLGDPEGALAQFDAAAALASDKTLKNSARIRAAYLVAESQDFQAVQARVAPIIEDGGPIAFLARELLGIEAWEAGETELARQTLENLTLAFDAPEEVRQRAQIALSVMGPPPETPAQTQTQTPAQPSGAAKQ